MKMKRLAMTGMMVVGLAMVLMLSFAGGAQAQPPTVGVSPSAIEAGIKPFSREDKSWGWSVKPVDIQVFKPNDGIKNHYTIGGGCFWTQDYISMDTNPFKVVVNEVHVGPDGNWVEIYNPSCYPADLYDKVVRWQYTLDGLNWIEDTFAVPGGISNSLSVAPRGYMRFVEGTGTNTAMTVYTGRNFNWSNATGGRAALGTLTFPSGNFLVYDYICWGDNPDCPFSLATPGSTQSLGRNGYGTDVDLSEDFHYYSVPTPEAINDPGQTPTPWIQIGDKDRAYYDYSNKWPITSPGGDASIRTGNAFVGLDANGLPPGTYTAALTVFTDIPGHYSFPLPVTFHVGYPDFSASAPAPLEATLVPGDIAAKSMTLINNNPFVAGRYWLDGGFSQNYDLRINEVYMGDYSGSPSPTWVEFYNASDHPVSARLDIAAEVGSGVDHRACSFAGILPGAFLRVIGAKGLNTATEVYCEGSFRYVRPDKEAFLSLGSDNDVVDFGDHNTDNPYIYSSTGLDQWIETGNSVPNIPLYQSLARDADATDYDRDTDWSLTTSPTPGAPNGAPTFTPSPWLSYGPNTAKVSGGSNSVISVKFNAYGLSPGDYTTNILVRTGNPANPLLTVPVTLHVQVGAIMNVASEFIDDDNLGASLGNGNLIVEPNETIEMGVVLHNSGILPAWNAAATLSTSDPYIAVIQNASDFGIIQPNASKLSLANYTFAVDPSTPNDHQAVLNLHVTTQNGEVWDLPITVKISVDSDYDGLPDYWEQQYAACGLDYLVPDAAGDPDHDGSSNLAEYQAGTDPCNPDTDNDCILDGQDNAITPGVGCENMVVPPGTWKLRVTLLAASAALDSDVYLYQPQEELLVEHSLANVGAVSTMTINGGSALVLYIRVHGEPLGLGTYDHYSNTIYAGVTDEGYGTWVIGFEDLPSGPADWDYNDVVVLVEVFPANKHNGVTVNYLGESELTTTAGDAASLTADLNDPATGFNTSLTIPRADLTGDAAVILTNADPALYNQVLATAPFIPIDVMRKVVLTNGQEDLGSASGTITLSYLDQDQNGLVDGTGILEGSLGIYRYDAHNQTWVELDSAVNPAGNSVTASTSHFSLFAVGADPGFTGGTSSSKHHGSGNSGNWFGCSLNPGLGAGPGLTGLAPLFLIAAAVALAARIRRSKR
jgi:hypothetical protein